MRLLVIGAGGHAKVVVDAATAAGWEIAAVIGRPGDAAEVLGHPVTTDAASAEADAFVVAVGDNAARARLFARNLDAGLTPATLVHPSAVIGAAVVIEPGTFVAAGAVVNACAHIGRDAIVNTGCTVDHDCRVGDHALVGPTASMCGGSAIGDGVTLGAGATLIPGVRVGEWSVVGAGAAVVADLPAHITAVGVPARLVTPAEG